MTARKNFGRTTLANEMRYDALREKNIARANVMKLVRTQEALKDIDIIERRQRAHQGGVCVENLPMPPAYRRKYHETNA